MFKRLTFETIKVVTLKKNKKKHTHSSQWNKNIKYIFLKVMLILSMRQKC